MLGLVPLAGVRRYALFEELPKAAAKKRVMLTEIEIHELQF
jgi:hypothetical protein